MKTHEIALYGANLMTAMDEVTGLVYVAMKPLVIGMGLSWGEQSKKLNSDNRYSVICIPYQTGGGIQEMISLAVDHLPAFLYSINPNKVRKDLRDKIISFQAETFAVINAYWREKSLNQVTSQTYEGKSIHHVICGYKSKIVVLNKTIAELRASQKLLPSKSCEERLEIAERIASEGGLLRPWSCEEIRVMILGLQVVKDTSWLPPHLRRMKGSKEVINDTLLERHISLSKEHEKLKKFHDKVKGLMELG